MKRLYVLSAATAAALVLTACSQHAAPGTSSSSAAAATTPQTASASASASNVAASASSTRASSASAPAVAGSAAAPAKVAAAGAGATGAYQYDPATGKHLYFVTCSVCHQATGVGMAGVFPPLKDNPVVTDNDATKQILTVLHGASGPLTILGAKYNGTMPAFGNKLSDTDIANIINYERSSWGNHSQHTTPQQVAEVRASGKH